MTFLHNYMEYMGYVWLLVAIALLFFELGTPGLFFFVSFAVGALAASGSAFLGYSLIVQCVAGLSVSVGTFALLRVYLRRAKMSEVSFRTSHTNIDALLGGSGVVIREIKPYQGGRVKVGGETWRARSLGDKRIENGASVEILRIEGNTIIVKQINSGDSK